jgi:hypothetical protein
MAASDDFKQQLKAGKIVDALTLALGEAIELEITTWVSSESGTDSPLPGNRLRTRMNIVDGEIDNEVGPQFIGNGPYIELRQFHLEQLQVGRQMMQSNLATLQQLFVTMATTLSQLPPASRQNLAGNPAISPVDDANFP